jgi:hypothetical protein
MSGAVITMKVDGQVIEGEIIFLRLNDLTVEITRPSVGSRRAYTSRVSPFLYSSTSEAAF